MVIALCTDFGTRDAYVAQLKGAILQIHPSATLVDLTHEVPAFDIRAAATLLEASAHYFPAGTIFVAVVDPGVGTARHPLVLVTRAGKYYLGPDNGLFTEVVACEGVQAAYILTQSRYFLPQVSATFHGRDIFGPVAAHLARGTPPEAFGPPLTTLVHYPQSPPHRLGNTLVGEVRAVDRYGNIATNIPAALLAELGVVSRLTVTLGEYTHGLSVVTTYGEGAAGQLLGLLNSNGMFEVALPGASAAARLAVQVGTRVLLTSG